MKKWMIGCGSIFGAFILLGACVAAFSGGDDTAKTPAADTTTPAEKPADKPAEPKAPAKFEEVFKGTAQMTGNSQKFDIKHGNEVKLDWEGSGGDMALFSVILKNSDGGTVETVMGEMGETKGSQTFYNIAPGTYFLQWNTANFKPTVTIEEK